MLLTSLIMNNLEASKAPPSSLEASDVTYTTNTIQKGGWLDFKSQFIQHDGRVIDLRQNSISHSEGQAYGLLLAVNFDDKKSFDSIWKWSKDNLQTREDNLFSWSWGKNEQQVWQVLDKNNATDGDVLIAYALMLAAKKWQQTDYLVKAKQITQSILDTLTVKVGKRTFLLPAEYGFVKKDNVRLNPSYQILAAYRLFAEQTNNKLWSTIEDDARWLIEQSFDEKSGLPADWLWFDQMTGHIVKKSNQFGYEAVRIYLYQLWESERNDFWQPWEMFERFLKSGVLYSVYQYKFPTKKHSYSALSGIYQIYSELARRMGCTNLADGLQQKALVKLSKENQEYYGYALYLLSQASLK